MDEDMKKSEIVIAQRLASGESGIIRKRALNFLREYIKQQSAKNAFTSDSMVRLCKGLHYALWMQDKMILQEELADNICDLFNLFQNEEEMLEFVNAMIFSLSKEWPSIDRWRMDKFLMLLRRIVRTLFGRLAQQNWDPDLTMQYLNFFSATLISQNSKMSESLKYHCASIWLDELDNAAGNGGFGKEKCLQFLRPYINLLQQNISDTFFGTICTDIFDTILHDFSEEQANSKRQKLEEFTTEEKDKMEEEVENGNDEETHPIGLEFDYAKIAEQLFEAGKQQGLAAKRRKRIYGLCKKFENASKGMDPIPHPLEEDLPKKKRNRRKRRISNK